jgi:RND superfamily putative drug exporter
VLLVAVGVDYNVFLMARLQEEARALGLRAGINRAIAQTGGLISSAAAITACSFAALLFSPLASLRQLGLALVVGITVDAVLVRPLLVPCGQWLMYRGRERRREHPVATAPSRSVTWPAWVIEPPGPGPRRAGGITNGAVAGRSAPSVSSPLATACPEPVHQRPSHPVSMIVI